MPCKEPMAKAFMSYEERLGKLNSVSIITILLIHKCLAATLKAFQAPHVFRQGNVPSELSLLSLCNTIFRIFLTCQSCHLILLQHRALNIFLSSLWNLSLVEKYINVYKKQVWSWFKTHTHTQDVWTLMSSGDECEIR